MIIPLYSIKTEIKAANLFKMDFPLYNCEDFARENTKTKNQWK